MYVVGRDNIVYAFGGFKEVRIGELVMMESGYYEFFPDLERGGYWSTWMLRDIADLVDGTNAEWDARVKRDVGVACGFHGD